MKWIGGPSEDLSTQENPSKSKLIISKLNVCQKALESDQQTFSLDNTGI